MIITDPPYNLSRNPQRENKTTISQPLNHNQVAPLHHSGYSTQLKTYSNSHIYYGESGCGKSYKSFKTAEGTKLINSLTTEYTKMSIPHEHINKISSINDIIGELNDINTLQEEMKKFEEYKAAAKDSENAEDWLDWYSKLFEVKKVYDIPKGQSVEEIVERLAIDE